MSLLTPGIYASLSLCIPPKVRSLGYSMSSLFVVPGVLTLELVGYIATHWGIRQGLLFVGPIFLAGAWTLASASLYVKSDINRVWTSTAAQAEVAYLRQQGLAKLLLVRNLDVGYDGVQVLFGVNFEIDEGEIVALLGTNGAGKSTLLKSISGLVEATNGAIVFDGRDMTYAPPNEVAGRGVVQVPGGAGVFPSLSVSGEPAARGLAAPARPRAHREGIEHVLSMFPILRERLDEPAGNLSGGQQQMLTLGMAFVTRPRLLMIDELSLGLAPAVVEQLLPIVHEIRDNGHDDHPGRAVGEPRAHARRDRVLHGEGRDPLPRTDGGVARTARCAPLGVPRGRRDRRHAAERRRRARARHERRRDLRESRPRSPSVRTRLALNGVGKSFGGLRALNDVTVAIGGGEIVGFLGPNGAGKTTLFDVVSGFLPADSGSIAFDDGSGAGLRDVTRLERGGARPPRSRPLVPGRPALPRAHRRGDRSRSRSSAASRCAIRSRRRCTSRRSPTPSCTSTNASSSCSNCSASPTSATS